MEAKARGKDRGKVQKAPIGHALRRQITGKSDAFDKALRLLEAAGGNRVELNTNPMCLHCAIRDLVTEWIEDGLVDAPSAVGHIANAMCDLISWAPADTAKGIVALMVSELPAKVDRKLVALAAGTTEEIH